MVLLRRMFTKECRQGKRKSGLSTILLAGLITLLSLVLAVAPLAAETNAQEPDLKEVQFWLNNLYIAPIDWEQVEGKNATDIIQELGDPYTNYLNPRDYEQFTVSLAGSFGGIGIHVESADGYVTVVAPLDDTPAFNAGLQPKDRIVEVNGLDVVGVPLEQAVDLIRGEPGTIVELTILRVDTEFKVKIERDIIELISVSGELLEENIGYLRIATFGENTALELEAQLRNLEAEGALAFIIDVRYNGGGYLQSALDILEVLLPPVPVLHVVDREGDWQTYETIGGGIEKPMAILVNEGSASASEILAGAIQDNQFGALIGTETFGKASVQQIISLSNGGFLKMTVAHYLTPLGSEINNVGLKPDIYEKDMNKQLEVAVEYLTEELADIYPQAFGRKQVLLTVGSSEAAIDGVMQTLSEVPFIENSRTYVPIRIVSENLGLNVTWRQETGDILIEAGETTLLLTPNSTSVIRGEEKLESDVPVLLRDARSYLPVRFLVEALGGKVDWDFQSQEITIIK